MANFNKFSRYSEGVISYKKDNSKFVRLRRILYFDPAPNDKFVEIKDYHKKRPDLLSMEVYGRPDLFWVIFDNNGIIDSYTDLVSGQIVRCPNKDKVLQSIKD